MFNEEKLVVLQRAAPGSDSTLFLKQQAKRLSKAKAQSDIIFISQISWHTYNYHKVNANISPLNHYRSKITC